MNKKGVHPLATGLLIVLVFVLVGFAWYNFQTKISASGYESYNSRLLEKLYSEESMVNYYIFNLVESAAEKTDGNAADAKEKFIENLRAEIAQYKLDKDNYVVPEFGQLERQISAENVNFENGILSISFKIKIDESLSKNGWAFASASYVYTKKFEGIALAPQDNPGVLS